MTREDQLNILLLLAGLESWAMSMEKRLPVYLSDQLAKAVSTLSSQILEGKP